LEDGADRPGACRQQEMSWKSSNILRDFSS
jgi:hypothetical protein